MDIVQYAPHHKAGCLSVFKSNTDPYFAPSEYEEFEQYLDNAALDTRYYAVLDNRTVVGCGGFSLYGDRLSLDWGMVERERHRSGIGKLLLQHRLEQIHTLHGDVPVHIDTSQHSEGFFRGFGFEMVSVEEDGFTTGLHKVAMVRLGRAQRDLNHG